METVWEMRKDRGAWWEGLWGRDRERELSKSGMGLGRVRGGDTGSDGLASSCTQVSALAPCEKGNPHSNNPHSWLCMTSSVLAWMQ